MAGGWILQRYAGNINPDIGVQIEISKGGIV
jgi:hypothetical protein